MARPKIVGEVWVATATNFKACRTAVLATATSSQVAKDFCQDTTFEGLEWSQVSEFTFDARDKAHYFNVHRFHVFD